MTKYRKLMRGQHIEDRWLLTVANGRALGMLLLAVLWLLTLALRRCHDQPAHYRQPQVKPIEQPA